MTEAEIIGLITDYGLWIIAPIALVEGPAISVVSGYLVRLGVLPLGKVYGCLVLADLMGDLLVYGLGAKLRTGPKWPILTKLGITRRRLAQGLRSFRRKGGRYLILAKLTHSAGFPVLFAAGLSRMSLVPFIGFNLLATLPKVAAFMLIGWVFGEISGRVGGWLWIIGLIFALITAGVLVMWRFKKKEGPKG